MQLQPNSILHIFCSDWGRQGDSQNQCLKLQNHRLLFIITVAKRVQKEAGTGTTVTKVFNSNYIFSLDNYYPFDLICNICNYRNFVIGHILLMFLLFPLAKYFRYRELNPGHLGESQVS